MITLLNTTIVTNDGKFTVKTITLAEARVLVSKAISVASAIGHESTADILTALLGIPVEVNRINFMQQPEDIGLCFKLKGRPKEGVILSREEIESLGYEFKLMTMYSTDSNGNS